MGVGSILATFCALVFGVFFGPQEGRSRRMGAYGANSSTSPVPSRATRSKLPHEKITTGMRKAIFFCACLLLATASAMPSRSATRESSVRPNILLLMPDQWRWDWDGLTHPNAGDAPPVHLPHIDRLRQLGTTFPRGAVVPSPLCAPSRAAMA